MNIHTINIPRTRWSLCTIFCCLTSQQPDFACENLFLFSIFMERRTKCCKLQIISSGDYKRNELSFDILHEQLNFSNCHLLQTTKPSVCCYMKIDPGIDLDFFFFCNKERYFQLFPKDLRIIVHWNTYNWQYYFHNTCIFKHSFLSKRFIGQPSDSKVKGIGKQLT